MEKKISLQSLKGISIKQLFKNDTAKRTLRLIFITLLANLLGFFVPVYIANIYGVTKDTDSFLFSYSIVNFVGTIFSSSISAACVPFLKEKMHDKASFDNFVSAIFYYVVKYVGLLAIISFIVLFTISRYTNNNFCFFLSISVPIFFFIVVNAFYYGILNSLNQFNLAATSPFSRAIIIFATIYFLHAKLGIVSAILGYNLGEFAKTVHLTYVVRYRNKIKITLKRELSTVKSFFKVSSFQAISTTISASSPIFDKIVASFLPLGTISLLDYGDKMFTVFTVMLSSFLTIILSKWSGDVTKGRFKIKEMNKVLAMLIGCSICLCILIFFVRVPIVNFLYPKLQASQRGEIGILLTLNMLGFVFNSSAQIINRAVIAHKETKILAKMSAIRMVLNLGFDILLVYFVGIYGIVIATVLTNITCVTLLYIMFGRFRKKQLHSKSNEETVQAAS